MLRFLLSIMAIAVLFASCGDEGDEGIDNSVVLGLENEIERLQAELVNEKAKGFKPTGAEPPLGGLIMTYPTKGGTPPPPTSDLPTLPHDDTFIEIPRKPASPPTKSGKIAFSSDGEIYVMDASGKNKLNLTNHAADDMMPVWSPDGDKIAFISHRGGVKRLLTMDTDGHGLGLVTNFHEDVYMPAFSPNGQQIAFKGQFGGIHVVNVGAPIHFLNVDNPLVKGEYPAWSPDGTQIAYSASFGGHPSDIYVMDVHGGMSRKLTSNELGDMQPAWHPNGDWIVYRSCRAPEHDMGDQNWEIAVMGVDGSFETNLTFHVGDDKNPTWSRDGEHIAFASYRHPNFNWEIYVMRADGTGQTNITNNHHADDEHPSWK